MFINKLNQLYKPERILYYIDANDKEISDFYSGLCPQILQKYINAFGSYDSPGIFYLKELQKEVIGIEYRIDDPRIEYPQDLKSQKLEQAFFYSIEIDDDIKITRNFIQELFEKIARDDDAHRIYTDLVIQKSPQIIAVFSAYKKIRILYQADVDYDRAQYVINKDTDQFDKKTLYNLAFYDTITGHYNWNHLVSFLEMPNDHGIKDYAFVHFDIKEFRVINEVYGHIAANKVLCNIVKAMKEADFVYASARCHNDNFAMMIKDMSEEESLSRLQDFFEKLSHLEEDKKYKIFYRCGLVPMQKAILL